jgi:predicted nucleic acid-binding protein
MIVVCDMGPLHYLVLIGAEHILPQLFTRILAPPAVIAEMSRSGTPEAVRLWVSNPPPWLDVKGPAVIEEIPSLGKKGMRGAGEKAAIALAREVGADAIVMDDKTGRREARKRGLEPLWLLEVLDEAAERGLIADLPEKLEHLEHRTPFYVGDKVREVIEDMKQRDLQRKQAQEQQTHEPPEQKQQQEQDQEKDWGRGR